MKTYELQTIHDFLQVPIKRRTACMREVEYALALHELAFGENATGVNMNLIRWTDDGDKSVQLIDQGGGDILTLEVTDKQHNKTVVLGTGD